MVDRFEAAFAEYVGARAAVAVSSGTPALHLALRIMDIGPGDAVIVPTLTFIGGVAPIIYLGATPIFVDCESETWGLDPALVPESVLLAERSGLRALRRSRRSLWPALQDRRDCGRVSRIRHVASA